MLFEVKSAISNSLKDVDTGKRELVGMFANYKTRDMVGDLSTKGMFSKTWQEQKARVKHIHEHNMSSPIGKIVDLWEDDNGAYYRSRVTKGKEGDKWLEWAEGGLMDEHSFGFKTILAKTVSKGKRDLLEVKHFEVSSVTGWAVHGDTPLITVKKSLTVEEAEELKQKFEKKHKALDKLYRSSIATDEDIQEIKNVAELFLLEIKQLQQNILELSTLSTQAAEEAPGPHLDTNAVFLLNASIQNQLLKFSN
jgi:HK97 family phage prohead protease